MSGVAKTVPKSETALLDPNWSKAKYRFFSTLNHHGAPPLRISKKLILKYIFSEPPEDVDKEKSINPKMFANILATDCFKETLYDVWIPDCTTSTPLSLYEHAKANGLSRIFSCEKSELLQMRCIPTGGAPQFSTLFDHYHKAVFNIQYSDEKKKEENVSEPHKRKKKTERTIDVLAPNRLHQCIDDSSASSFGKYQLKSGFERIVLM